MTKAGKPDMRTKNAKLLVKVLGTDSFVRIDELASRRIRLRPGGMPDERFRTSRLFMEINFLKKSSIEKYADAVAEFSDDQLFACTISYVHEYEITPSKLTSDYNRYMLYGFLRILKSRFLHGAYSVLSFILNSLNSVLKTNFDSERAYFEPLSIGYFPSNEKYYSAYFSQKNFDLIEHFIDDGKLDIIVWCYLYTFHDFFMKCIAEKVTARAAGFMRSYNTYGSYKLRESTKEGSEYTIDFSSDEYCRYCECYMTMYKEIGSLSNIDQLIKDENFDFVFDIMMSKYINYTNYFLKIEEAKCDDFVLKRIDDEELEGVEFTADLKQEPKEMLQESTKEKTPKVRNGAAGMGRVHRPNESGKGKKLVKVKIGKSSKKGKN